MPRRIQDKLVAAAAGTASIRSFFSADAPPAAMWNSPAAKRTLQAAAPPDLLEDRRSATRGQRGGGGSRGSRGAGLGRGAVLPEESVGGNRLQGTEKDFRQLPLGALQDRWTAGPTAGMSGDKIRLTSSSQRAQLKLETLKLAFWNCCHLSVMLLDRLVGSQDGVLKGMGYDIFALCELHEDEQWIQKLWGSDRMLVGDSNPEDNSDHAGGEPLGLIQCASVVRNWLGS